MRTIYASETGTLVLGFQGEDQRLEIRFPLVDEKTGRNITEEFPGGSFSISIMLPGDPAEHIVGSEDFRIEGNWLIWTVREPYTVGFGEGKLQLNYAFGGMVKSRIWKTNVRKSINSGSGTVPSWSDWKTELLNAAAAVESAVDSYDEMTAEAEELPAGSTPTAEMDHTGDHPVLKLGIPAPQGGGGGAVQSVNGKTGAVVLGASDVGALPADTPIPPAVTVDSSLSDSSTNPVQNKVIKQKLDEQSETIVGLKSAINDLEGTLISEGTIRKVYTPVFVSENTTTDSSGLFCSTSGTNAYVYEISAGTNIVVTGGSIVGYYATLPVKGSTYTIDNSRRVGGLNNTKLTVPTGASYVAISATSEPSVIADTKITSETVVELKSAFDGTNNTIKNYLVESNLLHKESSLVVGDEGQTYQQKDFYTIEKNFVAGEKYTFSCDSVVGYTTIPMRYKVMNGDTEIRDGAQTQTAYLEITSEDVTAGANKVVFFVYASTSVAQSQPCVLTNPVVYLGWTTEEQKTYTENFDNEVERLINQSQPELETIQTLNIGTLEDGFINSSSGAAVSGSSYKRTGFIHVQANKLKVAITFSVADVGFAFYDSRKKYISGFDYTGYNVGDLKEVTVPENAYYFRYCAINANVPLMLVLIPNYANAVSRIDTNPCFYDVSSECRTFKKILCIGDSLTAGQFDYKEGGVTKEFNAPEYSYPTFLKALTGRDITNAGDAGETTVSWYELHGQEDFSGHDACIIMLGRNDYESGRETTSEQRATAFANIIAKVRLDNPQIPIFMATLINYYKGDAAETMNEDIRTAATANNCYLLDIAAYGRMVLADDAYSHCTAEGYYTLAEYFFRYISYIMHNNYTSFKTIQFVGTNRAY